MTTTMLLIYFSYLPLMIMMQQFIGIKYGGTRVTRRQVSVDLKLKATILLLGSMTSLMAFVLTTPKLVDLPTFAQVRATGFTLAVIGIFISGWAQIVLGKHWGSGGAALGRGHKLVQDGPFQYVRHPLYSGMFVSAVGLSLLVLNIWLTLCAVLMAVSFMIKAPYEEQLLAKKYKSKWRHYVASTGMFIPSFKKG